MTTTDTEVQQLIINILTEEQYANINPSVSELYMTPDTVYGYEINDLVWRLSPTKEGSKHLLDGALLQYGTYKDYIDYIGELYTSGDYPAMFETEANWQASVTTYGSCGKFVYDSVNKTVRLPKVSDILQGTTDVTALGDLVQAGLPNITGNVKTDGSYGFDAFGSTSGAFTRDTTMGWQATTQQDTQNKGYSLNFNASLSNPIYGNSSTVQPQTIKGLIYIIIATGISQSPVEININQVLTDLNGKADVDLGNTIPAQSFKNNVISWGMPDYINAIQTSLGMNVWRTANYDCFIIGHVSSGTNGGGVIALKDKNGNDVPINATGTLGEVAYSQTGNILMRCFVPKGYSYAFRVRDAQGSINSTWEVPLKGAN